MNYTTIEQSNKLLELGIDQNTADMFYAQLSHDNKLSYNIHPLESYGFDTFEDTKTRESKGLSFIPAWSLGALLSIINKYCIRFEFSLRADKKYNIFATANNFVYRSFDDYPGGINYPIDACYKIILKLKENNLL